MDKCSYFSFKHYLKITTLFKGADETIQKIADKFLHFIERIVIEVLSGLRTHYILLGQ